jgi:F0F1-type ATP synthase beta subunit
VLLRHRANPNIRLHGEAPLGRAVLMHDQRMVELLLKNAADPNLPAVKDITPLHRAAMRGHAAIAGVDAVSELVLGRMDSSAAERERAVLEGVERAETLRHAGSGRDVLLLIDAPPTGALPLEAVRPRIGRREGGSITLLVFDLLLPNTNYSRGALHDNEWDVQPDFDRALARRSIFRAIDVRRSQSRMLTDRRLTSEHVDVATEVRGLLDSQQSLASRAEQATRFQSQPFFVAEPWAAGPGAYVTLDAALAGYRAIVQGDADALDEKDLLWAGALLKLE